jgi:hypothetical protein
MTGPALFACALILLGGLVVFAIACRLSPEDCWDTRTARRVAAWRRFSPWLVALCSATVAAGLWFQL